jgi:hypothetical protein
MTNPNFTQWSAFLVEKHEQVKRNLHDLLNAYCHEGDLQLRGKKAKHLAESLHALSESLASNYRPGWIGTLYDHAHSFSLNTNSTQALQLLNVILRYHKAIQDQDWAFTQEEAKPLSFDEIFESLKAESRLDELYDFVIKVLEKIIESNEVDSVTLLQHLERLIATLKANQNGTLRSKVWSWTFVRQFMKHYTIGLLKKTPGIGPAVEALEKTMDDLDKETKRIEGAAIETVAKRMTQEREQIEIRELKGVEDKSNQEPPKIRDGG